jgi:hypothetical protein
LNFKDPFLLLSGAVLLGGEVRISVLKYSQPTKQPSNQPTNKPKTSTNLAEFMYQLSYLTVET